MIDFIMNYLNKRYKGYYVWRYTRNCKFDRLQFVVLYDGDECFGGGIIDQTF